MSASRPEPIGDAIPRGGIGARLRRVEDEALLRGDAAFLDDIHLDGVLHLAFARSQHAHAEIGGIDLAPARGAPGVEAVFGPADLAGLPPLVPDLDRAGVRRVEQPILAGERARFVGEPIAAVIASSPYAAEDAAERIVLADKPLPALGSIEAALDPGAPTLHGGQDNVIFHERFEAGNPDEAFASAPITIERTFRSARYSAAPLECRGALAVSEGDELVFWSSTQIPHILAETIARTLGLDDARVRVRCPEIGGGFGQKAHVFPEEILIAWAARELGRPVKWVEDRRENFIAAAQAREQRVRVRAAAERSGRLLAIEAEIYCDVGAYGIYPWGQLLEALGTPALIPGPYRLRNYRYATHAVVTNKAPQGAYRGVGQPVSVIVHERVMDIVAAELELDPAEIRRVNFLPADAFPYTTISGLRYDSGDYRAALDTALEALDYPGMREAQRKGREEGRLLGIGIACYVEWTGTNSDTYKGRGMTNVRGYDSARLAINPDGTVSLWTSCPGIGQGLATTLSQVAAQHLGVPVEAVRPEPLDTRESPPGSGTFASRGAISAGGALIGVSATLRARLVRAAAAALEANPDDIVVEAGRIGIRGSPSASLSLAELHARSAPGELDVSEAYDPEATAYPYATHVCVVEIDPGTGEVRIPHYVIAEDCGPEINPIIVEGQVHGATAQGIGGALYEALRFGDDGQMTTASFMDYLIPGACELPYLEVHHLETPAPDLRGGFKGVGEGGTIAPPAAIANAVSDALGIEVNELPVDPELAIRAAAEALARGPSAP